MPAEACHWNSGLYQDNYSFVWRYGKALLELLARVVAVKGGR